MRLPPYKVCEQRSRGVKSHLRVISLLDLDLNQLPLEQALGVYWDVQSDTFKFNLKLYKQGNHPPSLGYYLS